MEGGGKPPTAAYTHPSLSLDDCCHFTTILNWPEALFNYLDDLWEGPPTTGRVGERREKEDDGISSTPHALFLSGGGGGGAAGWSVNE